QMYIGGNAGILAKDYLENGDRERKDYRLDWAAHFIMPCNLHLPPIVKSPTGPKIQKIVENEEKYIDKFVEKIGNNEPWIEGGFDVIRGMFSLKFPVYKKLLEIDNESCNQCNLCYEICPMDNISIESGNYQIKDNCYFCVRCYNFCPKNAIKITLEKVEWENANKKRYKGPIKDFDIKKMLSVNN
ncbi:MAG: 4Fe-4S dicluster domain-containing protein, partial [Candidatus Lokiarchaeota archaeon]|nr:4Fe-4S dicluster domain-containing protein [Candidatus Lokiarchaeota archaeon]